MRKLLLASAAMLGAGGLIAPAFAQTAVSGSALPPTWTENPQPTAPSGTGAGNNNLNAQGFYTPGPVPAPTPGSIVVHFNGRVVFYGFANNSSSDSFGGRKVQPYGTLGYARFYQGVDAMASNGLRYGAGTEIRVNGTSSTASATSGGSSAASQGNTLFVRRAFAYVGGDWGALHFGQDDGPTGLMDAGITTFQTYNDGGWNDDLNSIGNVDTPLFPFPSGIGNEYTTSKIVYLSPQIAGFDFGLSFEPDDNPLQDTIGAATPNSPQLSTGITPGEIARRRNTGEAAVRYQGVFGPTGIYAFASYMGSGKVNAAFNATPPVTQYDGLSAFFGGAAVTIAGFRVGGSILFGDMNDQVALKPTGGKNMIAYMVGTQYTIGPATVGASYLNVMSAGAINSATGLPLASTRREGGINVGGTYVIAPGLLGWVSATYGQRYQGGFNFTTGATTGPTALEQNNVNFKAIALGGVVKW
jgi:hypothetical protein